VFVIIWRYRVARAHRDGFAAGHREWDQLFRGGPGYVGMEVLARTNEPDSFLVITRWESEEAFLQFQANHEREFEMLDRKYAALSLDETFLGYYESEDTICLTHG
jgi:heme-degrading monooxygenase HmoA